MISEAAREAARNQAITVQVIGRENLGGAVARGRLRRSGPLRLLNRSRHAGIQSQERRGNALPLAQRPLQLSGGHRVLGAQSEEKSS